MKRIEMYKSPTDAKAFVTLYYSRPQPFLMKYQELTEETAAKAISDDYGEAVQPKKIKFIKTKEAITIWEDCPYNETVERLSGEWIAAELDMDELQEAVKEKTFDPNAIVERLKEISSQR